ncbi:MAG: hypothetical protein WC359_15290 [Dehalococcoidia bacterium]|jgi:hypothetical protein
MEQNITFTRLTNGLIFGHDKEGLTGLWLSNGTPYLGDLAMMFPDAYLLRLQGR